MMPLQPDVLSPLVISAAGVSPVPPLAVIQALPSVLKVKSAALRPPRPMPAPPSPAGVVVPYENELPPVAVTVPPLMVTFAPPPLPAA